MKDDANLILGIVAVLTEVTLSGFASIYFEKVIKTDVEQLNIWERNFQLALGSFPVYLMFIFYEGGGEVGYLGGWSRVTFSLAILGAAGGLLVALSIKYGDAILKTLATTGSIVLSSVLDKLLLDGPLTWNMVFAGMVVITSICDYTFDSSPAITSVPSFNRAPKNDHQEIDSSPFHDEEKITK
jgi:UDP-sugar transporter A1/2/3